MPRLGYLTMAFIQHILQDKPNITYFTPNITYFTPSHFDDKTITEFKHQNYHWIQAPKLSLNSSTKTITEFKHQNYHWIQAPKLSPGLTITLSYQQNTHVFADGRKNMNDIFNNYVCSASHNRPGLHFQSVWREPCITEFKHKNYHWIQAPKLSLDSSTKTEC